MLIFVVDDSEHERNYLTQILASQQYEVVSFADTLSAADHLRTVAVPDVLLVDYQFLGGPNGTNLAKMTRQMFPNTVVIMLSAFASVTNVITAFRQGVDDFIVRPFEPDELPHLIGDALLRRRALRYASEPSRIVGDLEINLNTRHVLWHGIPIRLTPIEFSLVIQLTAIAGRVINYAELYSISQGEHLPPAEARLKLKSHIKNLKAKFKRAYPSVPHPICNDRGFGFKWDANCQNEDGEG